METCHGIVLIFLAVFSITAASLTTDNDCPKFDDNGNDVIVKLRADTCYYFHIEQSVTFEAASAVCGGRGGTLAMPESDDTSDFLKNNLASHGNVYKAWVGMLEDSNPKTDAFFWLTGEKVDTDFARKVLQYGFSFKVPRRNGVWQFGKSNKAVKNIFICEIKEEMIEGNRPIVTTVVTPTKTGSKIPIERYFCPVIDNDVAHMKFFGESCFYFHFSNSMKYYDADAYCKAQKGKLATVNNAVVDLFLQFNLQKVFGLRQYTMWIGLHKDQKDATPLSWDDGTPVTYTNFRFSFPAWDTFALTSNDFKWQAYPPDLHHYFICQFNSHA